MLYTLVNDRKNEPELTGGRLPDGLLTAEETTIFQSLKTEKRRRDRLHGRYTAKTLVRQIFEEAGVLTPFTGFSILNKENGAPYVSWMETNGHMPLTLSISHAGDLAFCAALLEADARLGCDVEQIAPRSGSFIADYFTTAEQTLVEQAPDEEKDALVNAIWSGKEAALKALELGLRADTRSVACLPEFGRGQSWQPLSITLVPSRLPAPVSRLTGQWRVQEDYVFTIIATNLDQSQISQKISASLRPSAPSASHPSNHKEPFE